MANIEITVRSRINGPLVVHERFEVSRDLALEFVQKMAAMVKTLPGQHRLTQVTDEAGRTVVEITLHKRTSPPSAIPSFADLFRHSRRTQGES